MVVITVYDNPAAVILSVALAAVSIMSSSSADAQTSGVVRILSDFQQQCESAQTEVLPEIDAELKKESFANLLVDDGAIYEIEITSGGKKSTVVYTAFNCSNVGYAWCGSGGCRSFLVVDDVVFDWNILGGKPFIAKSQDQVFVVSATAGFACTDSSGEQGFGSSDCYTFTFWDEQTKTFGSSSGSISVSKNLNP